MIEECPQCRRPYSSDADMQRLETEGDDSPIVDEVSIYGFVWQTSTGWSGQLCWFNRHPNFGPGSIVCTRPMMRVFS